jgi:hypothetical protein
LLAIGVPLRSNLRAKNAPLRFDAADILAHRKAGFLKRGGTMAGMDENPYKSPESKDVSDAGFRRWEPKGRWAFKGSVVTLFISWGYAIYHAADRDPQQFPAAMFAGLATLAVPITATAWAICFARDRMKRK